MLSVDFKDGTANDKTKVENTVRTSGSPRIEYDVEH